MATAERRAELLTQFTTLEAELGALLDGNRTHEISQNLMEPVRDLYLVSDRQGRRVPVVANLNVSLDSNQLTDLPQAGRFADIVRTIQIHDVLDANCLRSLDQHGEPGRIARHEALKLIWMNVRARIAVTNYTPRYQQVGRHKYPVHNSLFSRQADWSKPHALTGLIAELDDSGVFEQKMHDERYGIPFTSVTENPEMKRQWSTDSCKAGLIQRRENPHLWPRNMVTNAGFICTPDNMLAALKTVEDPEWYRSGDASHGIAHIFLPERKQFDDEGLKWDEELDRPLLESIKEDPSWFNRQRLESQALLLYWLVRTIRAGAYLGHRDAQRAELGALWGFPWLKDDPPFPAESRMLSEGSKEYVIQAIQALAMYLLAVEWNGSCYDFEAPSVSSWEETPLKGGCASDTCFMIDAMTELSNLLFDKQHEGNEMIAEIRCRLHDVQLGHDELVGSAEELLEESRFADFRVAENLQAFILAGNKKRDQMIVIPIVPAVDGTSRPTPTGVKQYPERGPDSSLALAAAYHSSFDPGVARDARIRLGIVQFLEEHLMNSHQDARYGMKRYGMFHAKDANGGTWVLDSYLNFMFETGLVMPGLVRPLYAQLVADEYENLIRDHMEHRLAMGTASPRDLLVHHAYMRFVAPNGSERNLSPNRDATTASAMVDRQQFSLPQWTAQWTIGPTACIIALAKAKLSALQHVKMHGEDESVMILLDAIEQALNRFINLCCSTIVENTDANGATVIRADGTELPQKFNIMEAFQVVPDVEGIPCWAPGAHTLPWSASQLRHGLELALEAARKRQAVLGS